MIIRRITVPFLFLALLLVAGRAYAITPTAVISPDNNMYVIECSAFYNARRAQLTVDYPASLGLPEVTPGGMADDSTLTVSNVPSMLSFTITPKNGQLPPDGILAYILFPNANKDNPVPVGLKGSLDDVKGAYRKIDAWYQGPNDPPRDPVEDPEDDGSGGGALPGMGKTAHPPAQQDKDLSASAQGEGKKGAAASPADDDRVAAAKPVPSQAGVVRRELPRNGGPAAKPAPPIKCFPGVVDRFRSFAGERTEAALRPLFAADPASPFRQSPAIAIADGRKGVTVTFQLASPGDEVNVIVLTGLRMLFFKYIDGGGAAEMIVAPKAGATGANLVVKSGDQVYDVSLTVAPPLEPDLAAAGVGGDGKLIRRDYNGDGVVDYLDDYMLMANRLARESAVKP